MKVNEKHFLCIGTAGWNLPFNLRNHFPTGSSLLERYSQLLNAVEINSSFYKSHKKTTYERWAATTPPNFQFSVKMFKQITHEKKLVDVESQLDSFIHQISGLQTKLGPILIQLPPTLSFERKTANIFFALLRNRFNGKIVIEPRHLSWAELEAVTLLQTYTIERVIADPVKVPLGSNAKPLFSYYRLHGSPQLYTSSYDTKFLDQFAKRLNHSSWVIFDNTMLGAALQNALELRNFFN